MTPLEKLTARLVENGVEQPRLHVRGTMDVWLRYEDGKVTGLDFDRDTFELTPGMAFVSDGPSGAGDDGNDLNPHEEVAAYDAIGEADWELTTIEDADGVTWWSE